MFAVEMDGSGTQLTVTYDSSVMPRGYTHGQPLLRHVKTTESAKDYSQEKDLWQRASGTNCEKTCTKRVAIKPGLTEEQLYGLYGVKRGGRAFFMMDRNIPARCPIPHAGLVTILVSIVGAVAWGALEKITV